VVAEGTADRSQPEQATSYTSTYRNSNNVTVRCVMPPTGATPPPTTPPTSRHRRQQQRATPEGVQCRQIQPVRGTITAFNVPGYVKAFIVHHECPSQAFTVVHKHHVPPNKCLQTTTAFNNNANHRRLFLNKPLPPQSSPSPSSPRHVPPSVVHLHVIVARSFTACSAKLRLP